MDQFMTRLLSISGLVVALAAPAAAMESPVPVVAPIPHEIHTFQCQFDTSQVRPHVEFLASPELGGRPGGHAIHAANYIVEHFEQAGLRPMFPTGGENASYFQEIPNSTARDGESEVMGRNLGAILPGSDPELRDEVVILSAHYDHLGTRDGKIFAGADDNASGVAMLLEVAQRLAAQETAPRRTIAFVAFDLEERMLFGSQWFAAHMPWPREKVALFMTADMIGRSLGDLDLPTVFVLGSEYAPRLKDLLDEVGEPKGLAVARLGIDLIGVRSDYGPFWARKIPFLFFSTGQSDVYHTPRDVPETLDYQKLARVTGLIYRVVAAAANDETRPRWTDNLQPNLDEARTLNRIATRLLNEAEQRDFGVLQLITIRQAKSRTEGILARGTMTPDEREWLVRLSQVMLFSVF